MTTTKLIARYGLEDLAKATLDAQVHAFLPGQRRALRGMLHSPEVATRVAAVKYVCRGEADIYDVVGRDNPYGPTIVGYRVQALPCFGPHQEPSVCPTIR